MQPHDPYKAQRQATVEREQQTASFLNAAKWGIWTWVAVVVLPVIVILGCCGFCVITSAIGSVTA